MKGAKTHISVPLKEITVSEQAGNQANGDILHVGRIVLDRREGNRVFIRTLRPDEKDTGEGVTIQKGEQVIFEAGALTVDLRQIDNQSPKAPFCEMSAVVYIVIAHYESERNLVGN